MSKLSGESLNILAASAANAISQNLSCEEITLLGLVFTVLGDAMGVIAAERALNEKCSD